MNVFTTQSRTPLYYPTFAFISLVFRTSTGLPTTQAVKPAIAELTKWQGTLSYIKFRLNIISFIWSNVAIYAAFIIEFLIIFGPKPVHKPLTLNKSNINTLII